MRICVWSNCTLDGAGSVLLIKYLLKDKIQAFDIHEVKPYKLSDFGGEFKGWYNNASTYDKIFIIGIDIPDDIISLVDTDKVIIINNQKDCEDQCKARFKQAKVIAQYHPNTTSLIYTKLKLETKELTDSQKQLIDIINDYGSFKDYDSINLQSIFNNYNHPKIEKFIARFETGSRDFDTFEQNAIKLFYKKLKDQLQTAEYYRGTIKEYNIISCFCNFAIDETAHFTLKKFNSDIAILVNTTTNQVFFRKKQGCLADLNLLSNKLCNGKGTELAAVGNITDTFLNFTKHLTPCS